ncbi:MAG: arsenite methyltransferase [candidate division Zixibacteria bacterium]|nr:arsenite methyltransferase [candidate division Zixibacteria bacterium]
MDKEKTNEIVREAYAKAAQRQKSCGCCGPDTAEYAKSIGYTAEELQRVPEESNLALGCGNPTALAALKEGEVVLDLGSGAGFDCFLAASKVGPKGKVIGVDMTPQMVEKATENAKKNSIENVEFRPGEIEDLPVEDSSVDVVISNCVINLSADKPRVFAEINRVLKPGGRVAISDLALLKELPQEVRESAEAYANCIAGAILLDEYRRLVENSGLEHVEVKTKGSSLCVNPDTTDPLARAILDGLEPGESLDGYVVSVYVEARKG